MPGRDLLHQVFAEVDSDEPRAVLADALQAHGDPKGELIALQLAAARDPTNPALRERVDQMIRAHGRNWLGELAQVAYRAQYQRGFLTRLELNGSWVADPARWARYAADPLLGTVEDLVPGRATGEVYARFVTSPAMTALRRIEVWDPPTLAALEATPAALVHVACAHWKRGNYLERLRSGVLPACARFPTLRSLGIAVDGFPALIGDPLFSRLTALTVGGRLDEALALWPRLAPQLATLTIAASAKLDECVALRVAWSGSLRITRTGERTVARVDGEWLIGKLAESFGLLPRLDRLEVEAGKNHELLVAPAKRRGVPLVIVGAPRRSGYLTGVGKTAR